MESDNVQLVEWIYAGRATLTNGKIGYLWWTPEGRERLFPKGTHGVIGAAYEVKVTLDGKSKYQHAEKFLRAGAADENMIESWTLRDRAAYTEDQVRLAEQRAKRDGDVFGEMTLNDVQLWMHKHPSQSTTMIAQVMRHITRIPQDR